MAKLLRLDTGAVIDVAPEADLMLPASLDVLSDPPDCENVGVIALEFPKFKDGRAFTQALIIRQRMAFGGELRAQGDVLPDQALLLRRVGFDTVELAEPTRADAFRAALEAYRYVYQRSACGVPVSSIRASAR